jgi:hypothetical protein
MSFMLFFSKHILFYFNFVWQLCVKLREHLFFHLIHTPTAQKRYTAQVTSPKNDFYSVLGLQQISASES